MVRNGAFTTIAPTFGAAISLLLALGWLLPNHYPPWPAFHSDAWVAVGLLGLFWLSVAVVPGPLRLSSATGLCLAFAGVPLLQGVLGLVPLPGDSLLSFAYLFGLALALALGEMGTVRERHQVVSWLFFALGFSSLVSVGLQIRQWTGGTETDTALDIWVMYLPAGVRPYGNLGQPNQLATLLLWGMLALMWGWRQGVLQRWMVLVGGSMLMFGLALTQSRTGGLSFLVLVALAFLWRRRDFGRQMLTTSVLLLTLYLVCLVAIPYLAELFGLPSSASMADRLRAGLGSDARWQAWKMFLDASFERPWLGYGWGHTRDAMFAVMTQYPNLAGSSFAHAHMLPLDLVLWVGWPLALVILGALAWWMMRLLRSMRRDSDARDALLLAALVVVGVHAMLELPLHYAYFLLPTGVFLGALHAGQREALRWFVVRKAWMVLLALCATVLLGGIVRDYLRVENSFVELRMERHRVGTVFNRNPPDTWLLNQWHDFIVLARAEPRAPMTETELAHWQALVMYFPLPMVIDTYMQALELNGRREEIADFRDRLCAFMPSDMCQFMRNRWAAAAGASPDGSPGAAPPHTSDHLTPHESAAVPGPASVLTGKPLQ